MSGFSPEWLRLREPADHQARDRELAALLAQHLGGRDAVRILDLGCGTGSNLRALAPLLPLPQSWHLVDHDSHLLEAARSEIERWRASRRTLSGLSVSFERADLNAELAQVLAHDCDVVTAAALLDLVSENWLDRFTGLLAERRLAFYTVLIYDGVMRWKPAHPADDDIKAAFNAHQRSDKGFGPAAGPEAGFDLADRLLQAGYEVVMASSPWRLAAADRPLIMALADGIAGAAGETGLLPAPTIASWLSTRSAVEPARSGISIFSLCPDRKRRPVAGTGRRHRNAPTDRILLRLRNLRTARSRRRHNRRQLRQARLTFAAARGGRGLGFSLSGAVEDRARLGAMTCKQCQQNAGAEKGRGKRRRNPGQEICCRPAGHKTATAAAHAERTALRPLHEHDRHKGGCNHQMEYQDNCCHIRFIAIWGGLAQFGSCRGREVPYRLRGTHS